MRIISRKAIREFGTKYSDSVASLTSWVRQVKWADWKNTADVRMTFQDADFVNGKVVFNIAGNRYRLIAFIAYRAHAVYIKAILTHRQYEQEDI